MRIDRHFLVFLCLQMSFFIHFFKEGDLIMLKVEMENGVCVTGYLSIQLMDKESIKSLEMVAFEVISKVEFYTQRVEEE